MFLNPCQTRLYCIVERIKVWIGWTVVILIWEQLESSKSDLWNVKYIFGIYTWRSIEWWADTGFILLTFGYCKKKWETRSRNYSKGIIYLGPSIFHEYLDPSTNVSLHSQSSSIRLYVLLATFSWLKVSRPRDVYQTQEPMVEGLWGTVWDNPHRRNLDC